MSRKSRIAVMILAAVLVSLSICAVPGAIAKPRSHTVGFRVIKHGSRFDVVKGHAHRFRVKHHAYKVSVRGVGRFTVVGRTSHFVLLASSRTVWTPRLSRVAPKLCVPASAWVNVWSDGRTDLGSVGAKWTVPRYPVAMLP